MTNGRISDFLLIHQDQLKNERTLEMVIIVKGEEECTVCGKGNAVVYCNGCGIPLCEDCRIFDMMPHGCSSVDVMFYCNPCHDDIDINPYGGIRPE